MQGNFLSEIRKLAEEVCIREGCYLYDIEFVGAGSARVLRVAVDKEGGVSVEDCSNVSRAINLRLDVEDIVPGGQYQLEVSSPGLERVLKEPRHYQGAVGRTINVKSFAPLAQFNETLPLELSKAKQLQGSLLSHDDKGIFINYQSPAKKGAPAPAPVSLFVPYESVTKAHVVFEYQEPQKKPGMGHKPAPHPKRAAADSSQEPTEVVGGANATGMGGQQK